MFKALAIGAVLVIIATDMHMVSVQGQEENLDKTTVRVANDLGGIINLLLHCQSKDNDLGVHLLGNGAYIDWSFRDNIFGTTLFWCTMKWFQLEKSFEIYNAKVDHPDCSSKCWRSVRQDGVYFYLEHKDLWVKRYTW